MTQLHITIQMKEKEKQMNEIEIIKNVLLKNGDVEYENISDAL